MAGVAAAVLAAGLALAAIALLQLDAPWVRARLLAAVRAGSGLDVDYGSLRLRPLSGAVVEGLVVRTPAALREIAPELVRVRRLELAWSPASLLGRGPRIERMTLEGVDLTLVSDERGRTSLDGVAPSPGPPARAPAARAPLSRAAAELLSSAPPIARLAVSALSVTRARARGGRVADRFTLRGLALEAEVLRSGGAYRLRVNAGSPSAPLLLEVARDGAEVAAAAARLEARVAAEAAPGGASASIDLRVQEQTLAPAVAVRELLRLDAAASFDPVRGRTSLSLSGVRAADGAAALEAQLEIADAAGAPPLVREAHGDLALERLLRLVPGGLLPARLGRGELHWRAQDVEVGGPALVRGGSLVADASLADLRLALPRGALAVASAQLAVRASREPGDHAVVRVRGVRLAAGPRLLTADGVEAQLDGARAADGAWSGTARLALATLDLSGAGTLALRDGRAEVRASALRVTPGAPLATTGAVALSGEIASLAATAHAGAAAAERVRWEVRVPLTGHAPCSAEAEVPVGRLRVVGPDAHPVLDGPARLAARLSDLHPDLDRPAASGGIADLSLALGTLQASLHAVKRGESADLELHASVPGVASLRGAGEAGAPWERTTIALASSARLERLLSADPRVEQRSELRLGRPALGGLSADELSLVVRSSGDAVRHRAEADVWLRAARGAGRASADEHVTLSAQLDRRRPSLEVRLGADGAARAALTGALSFDRARGVVRCALDGEVERLAPLARLAAAGWRPGGEAALSGLELAQLAVSAHGEVQGVLFAGPDGLPRWSAEALRAARGAATVEVRAAGLSWRTEDRTLAVPSGRWRATVRAEGPRRSLESAAELDEVHLALGAHHADATGVVHALTAAVVGDLAAGEAEVDQRLRVASLRQDLAAYPVEDARLTLRARRDRDGAVHLSELRLENAAGGTTLAAKGIVDLGGFRRRLSLESTVEQDLSRAWSAPDVFAGTGRVTVEVGLESPDLTVFRTTSAVHFDDVHARLPSAGIEVEALDGELPVSADLAFEDGRVTLLRQVDVNRYPMLRFADQHPLMSRASFLSVARLTTPAVSVAPLAGNLRIEQNVVSLSQLELGVRGGKITGACLLDWDGPRSTLEARVRATGVLSSRGEPFDGNAALVLSAADRSVEGRAEILRIGRRHLLDVLDLEDPHRASAAANRVRHALALGYPDRVRITFDHGFASARVTFGGLARLVQVDELRGIPMGPLVDKILAPLSREEP